MCHLNNILFELNKKLSCKLIILNAYHVVLNISDNDFVEHIRLHVNTFKI